MYVYIIYIIVYVYYLYMYIIYIGIYIYYRYIIYIYMGCVFIFHISLYSLWFFFSSICMSNSKFRSVQHDGFWKNGWFQKP